MKNKNIAYMFGSALSTVCSLTYAAHIQTLGVDESCVAIAGACTAIEGNLGAYYENPARVADFSETRMALNLRRIDTTNLDLTDIGGYHDIPKTNTEGEYAYAPTVAAYFPLNERWVVGFGIGAPFAITADWGDDSGIHRYNMSNQALFVLDLAPTVGFQATEKLSVGATISITALKHLRTETLIPDSFGAALPPALGGAGTVIPTGPNNPIIGSITLNTDKNTHIGLPPDNMQTAFDEAALVLGFKYDYSDDLSFGGTWRSRTKTTFEGKANIQVGPLGVNQTEDFELRLDMPGHIQVGTKYSFTEKLDVMFDFQRTFWSDSEGLGSPAVIKFDNPLLGFVNKLELDYDANDANAIRLGARYKLNESITLSAGYLFDESVYDDSRVDILAYDSDRDIYSAGLTWNNQDPDTGAGWIISSTWQFIHYRGRNIATGQSQNLGGVSLPALSAPDTLTFTANRSPFQFGGAIRAIAFSVQKVF